MMSCDAIRQHFDDYLDDELDRESRLRVDRHIGTCAACRGELTQLRSLIDAARDLDSQQLPDRDLWPAIRTRLETDEAAQRPWWLQLVAAGIALAILSVPLSVWWTGRGDDEVGVAIESEQPVVPLAVLAELARSEDGVLLARTDLVTAIERRRDVVEADTLSILEENMNLLDRAIGEIRTALEEDPQNLRLRMLLAARYQQERRLLQKVSRV